MAGITFPRDQIFRGWTQGETSRVVEDIGERNWWKVDEDPKVVELRKRIVEHHTSEVQGPYFYSARTICPLDIAREKHEAHLIRQSLLAMLVGIGVSLIVYWVTRSYFENVWKVCKAIADKKEYVAGDPLLPSIMHRYATVQDVWNLHPTASARGLLFLRNAFCTLFPFCTSFGWGYEISKTQPNGKREYHLIIDRSKDKRVCPSNFDIQKECDPLTQESISIQKLHSPQMIYLPNYVTEAKSFVLALLIAGKEDFTDPVYRREFTAEEREQILSQIERIFLISKGMFKYYFKYEYDSERPLDQNDFCRYMIDQRVFDPRGQFTEEAKRSLQEILGNDVTQALNAQIDGFVNPLPNLQQRETLRRVFKLNLLAPTGYIIRLKKDDIASRRILFFERDTGVSLRAPPTK